jgi:hypothetical protein
MPYHVDKRPKIEIKKSPGKKRQFRISPNSIEKSKLARSSQVFFLGKSQCDV